MSKLHLVFGGRVRDPQGLDFADLRQCDWSGTVPDYASALDAWRASAQRTVDDAEMKYVVVHLHRLLEPDSALDALRPVRRRDSGAAAAAWRAAARPGSRRYARRSRSARRLSRR